MVPETKFVPELKTSNCTISSLRETINITYYIVHCRDVCVTVR